MNYDEYFERRLNAIRPRKKGINYSQLRGCVYLVKSGDMIKIGMTINLPVRMTIFKTNNPTIQVIGVLVRDNYKDLEKELHNKFSDINHRNEWFKEKPEIYDYLKANMTEVDQDVTDHFDGFLHCAMTDKSEFRKAFEEWRKTHGHIRNWYEQTDSNID